MGSELRQHQRPHRPGVSSQAIACQNLASPSLTLSLSRLHLTNVWYRAIFQGTSLVVEGSGLRASTARGPSLIPGQGTKILQAVRYSQKKKSHLSEYEADTRQCPVSFPCFQRHSPHWRPVLLSSGTSVSHLPQGLALAMLSAWSTRPFLWDGFQLNCLGLH